MRLSQTTQWDLTASKKVLKAEILETLHVAQYNKSFSSAAECARLFKLMYPDSATSVLHKQFYSKAVYILKYGIADYLKKELLFDVKGAPYTHIQV